MPNQMLVGSVSFTRNDIAADTGFPAHTANNPAAGVATAAVLLLSLPEIVEGERQIPVRGGAGVQDIGGRKSLSSFRFRLMSMLSGYMGRFGQFESFTMAFPLRDEPNGANSRNLSITCIGKIRRRGGIDVDLNTDEVIGLELEVTPWTYSEQVGTITPKTIDYDWDSHFYAGGWNLDTNQAVSA